MFAIAEPSPLMRFRPLPPGPERVADIERLAEWHLAAHGGRRCL